MIDLNYVGFCATVSAVIAYDAESIAELFQELSEGTTGPALTGTRDFSGGCRTAALVPHLVTKYRAGGRDHEGEMKVAPCLFDVWKAHCVGLNAAPVLPSDWLEVEISRRTEKRLRERTNKVSRQPAATRTSRVEEWMSVISGVSVETALGHEDEAYDNRLSAAFNLPSYDSDTPETSEAFFITRTQLSSYAQDNEVDAFQGFADLFRAASQRSIEVPGAAGEYFAKVAAVFFHSKDSIADMTDRLLPSQVDYNQLDKNARKQLEEEIKAAIGNEISQLLEGTFKRLNLDTFPPELIVIPQKMCELESQRTRPFFPGM